MSAPDMSTRATASSVPIMLSAMVIVELCSGIVQGYLTPLLPAIGAELGMDAAQQSQIFLISQLAFAVMTPLLSRMGDLYGHRRVLRVALLMVAVGSVLMAAWPAAWSLTVGVVLQGALVGFFPLLIGILRSQAPERNRTGIGLLVGVMLLSIGLGGLIAGALSNSDPQAGLWVAVPVAVLALIAGLVLPEGHSARGGTVNLPAALLLTGGLVGFVLALTNGGRWGWASAATLGAGLGGIILLACWVLVELHSTTTLVDVRMFTNHRLACVCGVTFCVSFGTIGFLGANATFLAAPNAEVGYGMTLGPQAIATVTLLYVLTGFGSSTFAPRLARRIGDRSILITAAALCTLGFVTMALLHASLAGYLTAIVVLGIGNGLFQAATRTLSVEAVDDSETALAAGVNELTLSLGAAIGAAVIGAIFAAHPKGEYVELPGYMWAWGACAVAAAAGLGLSIAYRRGGDEQPSTKTPIARKGTS